MKTAAKYQNKTPEEIIRQYRKSLRLNQGLLILLLLLYVADSIRGSWQGDISLMGALFRLVLLIVITFPINVLMSRDLISLNLILNQNCAPVTYFQVMCMLEKMYRRKRNVRAVQMNEASGLMWSGQFSEALALAESLRKFKFSVPYQLSLLNIRFNCYKKLENLEGAMEVRREAEALVSSFTKTSQQKAGQTLLNIMAGSLALWQRDYEAFLRTEKELSAGYTAKIQKVLSAMHLAEADVARGEMESARMRLEYVIREGGTLYVVEEARCMLMKLG